MIEDVNLPDLWISFEGILPPAVPCPQCGSPDIVQRSDHAAAWMVCTNPACQHRGPATGTGREALLAWNGAHTDTPMTLEDLGT